MFDIGFLEILVVGVLALLVLGPERLPGAMRSLAKTFRSVRSMASGFKNEVEEQLRVHELHENLKKAEQQGMHNLSPDLQKTVEELKSAADSVNQPYKKPELDKKDGHKDV
ncbi:Sec-independent protein translocase protein TatB [Aliiglaciecola sp. M165]|uniref:Sec-independent protein translocase protein TatB n=1 Tax=Aliiglaciecola sp. M165 TaxID=2593649 RepID=UPI001180007A|nr:Sec-independent protein translocase protein TatB [Aliiglaciecola sp. M165]TRY33043.1 Sec-independent protein translocase subunit TatB [Aliiglaciecola sp. M165]